MTEMRQLFSRHEELARALLRQGKRQRMRQQAVPEPAAPQKLHKTASAPVLPAGAPRSWPVDDQEVQSAPVDRLGTTASVLLSAQPTLDFPAQSAPADTAARRTELEALSRLLERDARRY